MFSRFAIRARDDEIRYDEFKLTPKFGHHFAFEQVTFKPALSPPKKERRKFEIVGAMLFIVQWVGACVGRWTV